MDILTVITSKTPSQLKAWELLEAYDEVDYYKLGKLYAGFIDSASKFNIHNEIFDIFTRGDRL
jgi:hypothetical protein